MLRGWIYPDIQPENIIQKYLRVHFYSRKLTLIPAWLSDYIDYKVWYEITYPFPNWSYGVDK